MEERTKIAIKIALVVLLLAPLIFLGTCFPLGSLGFGAGSPTDIFIIDYILYDLIGFIWIPVLLSIFISYIVIKRIVK